MRRAGRGSIVNVSSVNGHFALAGGGFYAASKFALNDPVVVAEAIWQVATSAAPPSS
jgi:NAD(P)-dependent dehydrogenase (short-subunit alcohol dehydrogenase family)